VLDAEYIPGRGIEYVGAVEDPAVWRLIRSGLITKVSVAGRCRSALPVDGVKPEGLMFEELSLLWGEEQPGVPGAYVQVWEKLSPRGRAKPLGLGLREGPEPAQPPTPDLWGARLRDVLPSKARR
jgi:hypothetical protein